MNISTHANIQEAFCKRQRLSYKEKFVPFPEN